MRRLRRDHQDETRIAASEMLPTMRSLPHVICFRDERSGADMRTLSTTSCDDLVGAIRSRHASSGRAEKTRILDEFAAVTGFHRKHAMRLLRSDLTESSGGARRERRLCGDAVRAALVVTDIATGWTECAPLLVREQTLLTAVVAELRRLMPVPMRGLDTDNDSVFINATLRDYCVSADIEFTRCRPYRKNDQAWIEQKNGVIVRKIVGYRRLEGPVAAAALADTLDPVRYFGTYARHNSGSSRSPIAHRPAPRRPRSRRSCPGFEPLGVPVRFAQLRSA